MDLSARWKALWTRLGAARSGTELDALVAAYEAPGRSYHTLHHLRACLGALDGARTAARHPDEVELALWYHDAVYDPRGSDNEERSAAWGARTAREAGLASDVVDRIRALILATKHAAHATDPDAQLICDVDLAILGAAAEDFDAYERAIRAEYAWVPESIFRSRRAEILEGFLARPTIYLTDVFRGKYEAAARRNLTRSVAALRAEGGAPPIGPPPA
jgi:predicted metal-dependent HD superfamily phosphohydrolase